MKDFESFQHFSSAFIAAKLIPLVWGFNETQVMMKFEPFYAYNDRLLLFSDIKKKKQKAKTKQANPVPQAHISAGKLQALQRRGITDLMKPFAREKLIFNPLSSQRKGCSGK